MVSFLFRKVGSRCLVVFIARTFLLFISSLLRRDPRNFHFFHSSFFLEITFVQAFFTVFIVRPLSFSFDRNAFFISLTANLLDAIQLLSAYCSKSVSKLTGHFTTVQRELPILQLTICCDFFLSHVKHTIRIKYHFSHTCYNYNEISFLTYMLQL